MESLVGTTISHYRILSKLGAGGMGVVYEAEDSRLGRRVAVKFLSDELSRDDVVLERFQREARAASASTIPGSARCTRSSSTRGSTSSSWSCWRGRR